MTMALTTLAAVGALLAARAAAVNPSNGTGLTASATPAAPSKPGCAWTAPSGDQYDFSALVLPPGQDHAMPASPPDTRPFTYYYNFCGGIPDKTGTGPGRDGVVSCNMTDAACQHDHNPGEVGYYYSLGKLAQARWSELPASSGDKGVRIRYTGGSSVESPSPRDVTVTLVCSTEGDTEYGPAHGTPRGASYYITVTTPAACPKVPPPVATTCQQVLYENPEAKDGEYELECAPAGVRFKAYCAGMATGRPEEYLTLTSNPLRKGNYASYFCGDYCKMNDPSSTTVTTTFRKLRINPCTLRVDISDRTFATSTGRLTQQGSGRVYDRVHAAVAMSCDAMDDDDDGHDQGMAELDLSLTGLSFNASFRVAGAQASGSARLSLDRTQVTLKGGGFCGWNAPAGYNDYASLDAPQFVLQLAKGPSGPPKPPAPPRPQCPGLDTEFFCKECGGTRGFSTGACPGGGPYFCCGQPEKPCNQCNAPAIPCNEQVVCKSPLV